MTMEQCSPRFAKQPATGMAAAFTGAGDRLARWLRRQWRIRRNIDRLSALDDRMLADIGITRDQVRDVAQIGRLPGW